MARSPERRWYPASAVEMFASMIDGQLDAGQDQYQTLLAAESRPYCLDNATVERVKEVYGATKADLGLYDTQLARWAETGLSAAQEAEVERLKAQMAALHEVVDAILALAERLKSQTIEALMARNEIDVGLEWLLGRHGG
jgi:hypothetical protein